MLPYTFNGVIRFFGCESSSCYHGKRMLLEGVYWLRIVCVIQYHRQKDLSLKVDISWYSRNAVEQRMEKCVSVTSY